VVSPFGLVPDINGYAQVPQANSPYGTIFEINRQPNFEGKKPLPAVFAPTRRRSLGNIKRVLRRFLSRVTGR
jgi:hypothetical protein